MRSRLDRGEWISIPSNSGGVSIRGVGIASVCAENMTRQSTRKSQDVKDAAEKDVDADKAEDVKEKDTKAEETPAAVEEEEKDENEAGADGENSTEALLASIPNMSDDDILKEMNDMDQYAFDPKNVLLNRGQFNELLELQTDAEPEFMQEIIDMYCVDSQGMLDELKEILGQDECTDQGYDSARAALHKLRGSSSTLGAEGIQLTCESLRELCVNKDLVKIFTGPGSLQELETRMNELRAFLKKYTAFSAECVKRKLSREDA